MNLSASIGVHLRFHLRDEGGGMREPRVLNGDEFARSNTGGL
jgi:hypothetical protein